MSPHRSALPRNVYRHLGNRPARAEDNRSSYFRMLAREEEHGNAYLRSVEKDAGMNILTIIEKAGGIAVLPASATYSERKAVAAHLGALKAQGHAVVADELPLEPGQRN